MALTDPWRHPPGVPRVDKPRAEGRFYLPDGQRLGYAEYGDRAGPVVLWFHGTPWPAPVPRDPTAPPRSTPCVSCWWSGRGSGQSDPHPYDRVTDGAADMAHVADAFGAKRLSPPARRRTDPAP